MTFESTVVSLYTGRVPGVFDITNEVAQFCRDIGGNGLVSIFVPHATAGIAIVEVGAGSDQDLLAAIDQLLPADDRWIHRHGAVGHGRDHVLPGLISPSVTVPVVDGSPTLGTWQSITVVDTNTDNPDRHVRLTFLG